MYPDFIIAGAPKCGSSTLYTILKQHPEICMSSYKEPYLYLKDWGKDESYYQQKYFPECRGDKLIGEASIDYMFYPEVAKRILKVKPSTKFVFIFRNPVDRAFSHYWQNVKSGKQINSWNYLLKNEIGHNTFNYGFYFSHLNRFMNNHFDDSQIHLVIFEDFIKNATTEFSKICKFLNIKDIKQSDNIIENKGFAFRNNWLRAGIVKIKNSRTSYKKIPSFLLPAGKRLLNYLNKLNSKSKESTLFQLEKSRSFLQNYYYNDIKKLENLIGRKLPW